MDFATTIAINIYVFHCRHGFCSRFLGAAVLSGMAWVVHASNHFTVSKFYAPHCTGHFTLKLFLRGNLQGTKITVKKIRILIK
jgi:hypothetical protein